MMEKSPPSITSGDDVFVDLCEDITSLPSQFVDIVRILQQELPQLQSINQWLLKASKQEEKLIKYFQVYEYDSKLKVHLAINQLQGNVSLWWEEVTSVKLREENIASWEEFQKDFKSRYPSECYYDDLVNEFHELRLRHLTMDEFVADFTKFLQLVPYLKEEKAKV